MAIGNLLDLQSVADAAPAFLIPAIVGAALAALAGLRIVRMVGQRLTDAAEAVRKSETLNKAILAAMLDGCVTLDGHGVIVAFNRAAGQIFGLAEQEALGRPLVTLINEPYRGEIGRMLERVRRGGAGSPQFSAGDGGLRRDGAAFPLELAVTAFDLNGQPMFSCMVRDLCESWAASQQMRLMAAALEHAGDAISVLDADGVIQYVNRQYEVQTGFLKEEVVGRAPSRGASEQSTYDEIRESMMRTDGWGGTVKSRRRDGSCYEEDLTITPVRDAAGHLFAWVAVMRDVSKRNALEAERAWLAEALHHASDSVQIMDAQGCILYVNPACEKASGMRLGDIRGTRPEAFRDYSPDLASYEDMMRTIRGGFAWSGILKSLGQDGSFTEEHVTASPIRDGVSRQVRSYVVVKHPVRGTAAREEALPRASVA